MPDGFFYNLGRAAGAQVRRGRWLWYSVGGTDEQALAAEAEVGRDLAAALIQQLQPDPDGGAQQLLREIGARLAARVKNRRRRFHFTLVAIGEPNAFALPGGYVVVSRSLLELIGGSEPELAFVLGHEMGHVIQQDAVRRIVAERALEAAMRGAPLGRAAGAAAPWLRGSGLRLLQSAYSQDAELIADQYGCKLAAAGGFDPRGGVALLQQLQRISGRPGAGPQSEYFSTHPPFDLRIRKLRAIGG